MSVETDLQAQCPGMLYYELLAKVHEVLEQRLKAISGDQGESTETTSAGNATIAEKEATSSAGAGASTGGSTSDSAIGEKKDEHAAFGNSIPKWPIFPDTCAALQRLAKHFKLVVLSNVDRQSFRYTHALLSEGPTQDTVKSDLATYTYPEPNPNKFWHPQEAPGSKSPFTLILTAQDTGCYKPALGGFQTIFEYVKAYPEIFGDLRLKDGEDVKDKAMSVAQSLTHDHVPASQLGMQSVWIDRQSAVSCNDPNGPGGDKWTWRFATLGEFADAVEKEVSGNN